MALKPADRYASPKALADDIERWMADEPVDGLARAIDPPSAAMGAAEPDGGRDRGCGGAGGPGRHGGGARRPDPGQPRAQGRQRRPGRRQRAGNEANTDLAAANQRERERFDLAMSAIKLFHGEVSEDLLMKERQFEGLRTKLLRGAADFYGKLEGLLKGQTDPKSRAALGKAYDELGELTGKIGNKPEALAVHLKALAVRRELAAEAGAGPTAQPGWREARLDVARSLIATGLLREAMGDTPRAMASYEEARALAEGLEARVMPRPRSGPSWARHIFGSARCSTRRASPPRRWRRTSRRGPFGRRWPTPTPPSPSTRVIWQPATSTSASLLADGPAERVTGGVRAGAGHPSEAGRRQPLSHSVPARASRPPTPGSARAGETGRPSEALAAWEKARAIQQKLADANPNVTQFQSDLARIHNNIGRRFSQTGKPAEALAALEKGRAIRQALADANPRVTLFQRDLAISLSGIGELRQAEGHAAEAAEAYRKALAILERIPMLPPYDQFNVATIHVGLAGIAARPGSGLSAAEGRAEADRAMTWLRKAVDGGFRPPGRRGPRRVQPAAVAR